MAEALNKQLGGGIVTIPNDPELIPVGTAQNSTGWISSDGQIELSKGRVVVGTEEAGTGAVRGHAWGFMRDGTGVHFRKSGTAVQYFRTSNLTWTNIITGLTASAEYTFSPHTSTAGTFMFATGVDGIFKIHLANLGHFIVNYDSTDIYRGKSAILGGRMYLWDLPTSKTGLYGSYIDGGELVAGNYTGVTAEATASLSGSLANPFLAATMTIASPAVVTATLHGFTVGNRIVFATTGALPTGVVAGTVYYVIAAGLTTGVFQFSATSGGVAVNTSGSQSGVHTITSTRRNIFVPVFTITSSGEKYTESQTGILTGSAGGTGTINYITGAYTLSNAGTGTCTYQWEMSNKFGVTDFRYSATRAALEGFILNQGEGGDPILTVKAFEGKFYSLKEKSAYEVTIVATATGVQDSAFKNIVFRADVGLAYFRAAVVTGKGILLMDNSKLDKPQLVILTKNINGDNLEPVVLAKHFDFSSYVWDKCAMEVFGEYVVFSGRTSISPTNNKLFFYNVRRDTVDILGFEAATIATNAGRLYVGDPYTNNVYEILTGFEDDSYVIENNWTSNDERYGTEDLKKVKRLRLKGLITINQILQVSVSYDNNPYTLVGTIRGDGLYVDTSTSYSIGMNGIGTSVIGGEASTVKGSIYLAGIKISSPKFRKRSIKLQAVGFGYVSVNMIDDIGVQKFGGRLPSKYRSRQNVHTDGILIEGDIWSFSTYPWQKTLLWV